MGGTCQQQPRPWNRDATVTCLLLRVNGLRVVLTRDRRRRMASTDACRLPGVPPQSRVTFVNGMPGLELAEATERGQVVIGGCVIFDDQPDYRCGSCGHGWCADEQP
jgi:hypothetical protein